MMNIKSLLNVPPSPNILPPISSMDSPGTSPTPALTQSSGSSPMPATGAAPVNVRRKHAKDAAVFKRGVPKEPVNFRSFECEESYHALSRSEGHELRQQHQRFQVFPSGGEEGLIRDYVRSIPYNSDKKTFQGRTGRGGFELFQYTFRLPNEPAKDYVVMWDYQNGLVRITPFFKALNFAKTTPNKVLGANKGLREQSHSITGGSIAAQGYWMPYHCARAICISFCWDIRWALTPIFGESFLKDCLPPNHPDYQHFQIDQDIIRRCKEESESWSGTTPPPPAARNTRRADLPTNITSAPRSDLPGSSKIQHQPAMESSHKRLRPRQPKLHISTNTSFDTEDESSAAEGRADRRGRYNDSLSVSPKSKVSPASTWTTVNDFPVGRKIKDRSSGAQTPDADDGWYQPQTPHHQTSHQHVLRPSSLVDGAGGLNHGTHAMSDLNVSKQASNPMFNTSDTAFSTPAGASHYVQPITYTQHEADHVQLEHLQRYQLPHPNIPVVPETPSPARYVNTVNTTIRSERPPDAHFQPSHTAWTSDVVGGARPIARADARGLPANAHVVVNGYPVGSPDRPHVTAGVSNVSTDPGFTTGLTTAIRTANATANMGGIATTVTLAPISADEVAALAVAIANGKAFDEEESVAGRAMPATGRYRAKDYNAALALLKLQRGEGGAGVSGTSGVVSQGKGEGKARNKAVEKEEEVGLERTSKRGVKRSAVAECAAQTGKKRRITVG